MTGLSTRVTERDLELHFSKEGKVRPSPEARPSDQSLGSESGSPLVPRPLQVAKSFLVVEPRTRISRGFAFVTMDTVEDADRCVKYLNQSVLQGRYITVEKVCAPPLLRLLFYFASSFTQLKGLSRF